MATVSLRRISPVARAVAVIGSVMALVTGVTFATLTNTATLTGNTINTNVDGLLVDSDGDNTFANTDEGFDFSDVEPGSTSDPEAFKLKNSTDHVMDVRVQVTGESALPAGVDGSDITFHFDTNGDTTADVTATWAMIIPTDGVSLLDDLAVGATSDVSVWVEIDPSVPDDVSIAPFNFTFGEVEVVEET